MNRFDGAIRVFKCNEMLFPHMKRHNGLPSIPLDET